LDSLRLARPLDPEELPRRKNLGKDSGISGISGEPDSIAREEVVGVHRFFSAAIDDNRFKSPLPEPD